MATWTGIGVGPAANHDIVVEQGSDFSVSYTLGVSAGDPYDLTGAVFAAQAREAFQSGTLIVTFTVNSTDLANGTFEVVVTAATTAALVGASATVREGLIGYWDLEMTLAGKTTRIVQGQVTLSQEVTIV